MTGQPVRCLGRVQYTPCRGGTPMTKAIGLLLAAALLGSCATMPDTNDAARRELAPTGKLRAGMNLQNTLFTSKAPSGELQGVSVDVMNELGRRLGVPVE